MTKAEFLSRLVTAVTRMRNGIEPINQPPSLVASDPTTMATGWAKDIGVYLEDVYNRNGDNPVVVVIREMGSVPSGSMTLEQYAMVEIGWEYFDRVHTQVGHFGKPVEEMELGIRTYNCLKNANIQTIGELVQKTEVELLNTKNFGRKSINELKEELAGRGLQLGMKTK